MRRSAVSRNDEWTPQEGARDVLGFLVGRLPWAILLWLALSAALIGFANLGASAGPLSAFMILIGVLCLPAGAVVGMTLSKGLTAAVHFVGWIPALLAGGAAIVAIAVGSGALTLLLEAQEPFFGALVPVMGTIGAAAAVARFTWADA